MPVLKAQPSHRALQAQDSSHHIFMMQMMSNLWDWAKVPAGVCSSCWVHQCGNIPGVALCSQHLVKQTEGSHYDPQGLAQNPIAQHWGAWFSPFPPSKLVESSASKLHCSSARTPFPTWERLIPSGVSRPGVDKSSHGQKTPICSIDTNLRATRQPNGAACSYQYYSLLLEGSSRSLPVLLIPPPTVPGPWSVFWFAWNFSLLFCCCQSEHQ